MSQHLTDASVKRLKVPERGSRIYYDAAVKGLGVRVTAAGARSFILNYRTKVGRERRATLGSAQDWQVTAARARAKDLKKQIDNGGDPLADVEQERAAPTVTTLIDRFEVEHLPKRRAGTQADYKSILTNHVRPHWGRHVKVIDVTTDDIEQLHRKISSADTSVAPIRRWRFCRKCSRSRYAGACVPTTRAAGSSATRKQSASATYAAEELARLLAALAAHSEPAGGKRFPVVAADRREARRGAGHALGRRRRNRGQMGQAWQHHQTENRARCAVERTCPSIACGDRRGSRPASAVCLNSCSPAMAA